MRFKQLDLAGRNDVMSRQSHRSELLRRGVIRTMPILDAILDQEDCKKEAGREGADEARHMRDRLNEICAINTELLRRREQLD